MVVQEYYGASEEKNAMMMENLRTLVPRVRSVRSYGSAGLDLAYLTMGAVDLYFDSGLHIWDYAGPSLIVREVGTGNTTKWTPLNTKLFISRLAVSFRISTGDSWTC